MAEHQDWENGLLAEAQSLITAGRMEQAKVIYARLCTEAPHRVEPLLNLGVIALQEAQFDAALSFFEQARSRRPDLAPVLAGQGQALLALGRAEEALDVFEAWQGTDPHSGKAVHGMGEALTQLGRLGEARKAFERAVALEPGDPGHHIALANSARFVANDPRLPGLEALARHLAQLPPPAQCDLHFALAKAYDDLSRPAEAFQHWRSGNVLKRRAVDYSERAQMAVFRDLAAAFPAEVIAARQGHGDPSDLPVFVVGMPRSGTTLVEQILASHPAVFGAGERSDLPLLLAENIVGEDFPAHFSGVPDSALAAFGSAYVARMKALAPDAKRIVDKLPFNFLLCGLIHLALPRARIIHVRRDALDTCLSCYGNLFSQGMHFTYDLGELGRYWRGYDGLMAHWRAVLPQTAMLEVAYEDLVANFETEARRLIAYCGLPWDERCLAFDKTARVVHTVSVAQVREPLYRRSLGRAAPYRKFLGPLLAALG